MYVTTRIWLKIFDCHLDTMIKVIYLFACLVGNISVSQSTQGSQGTESLICS